MNEYRTEVESAIVFRLHDTTNPSSPAEVIAHQALESVMWSAKDYLDANSDSLSGFLAALVGATAEPAKKRTKADQ